MCVCLGLHVSRVETLTTQTKRTCATLFQIYIIDMYLSNDARLRISYSKKGTRFEVAWTCVDLQVLQIHMTVHNPHAFQVFEHHTTACFCMFFLARGAPGGWFLPFYLEGLVSQQGFKTPRDLNGFRHKLIWCVVRDFLFVSCSNPLKPVAPGTYAPSTLGTAGTD